MSSKISAYRALFRHIYANYSRKTFTPLVLNNSVVHFSRLWNTKSVKWITMLALFWPVKKNNPEKQKVSVADIIEKELKEADRLYDNGQYSECCEFLKNLQNQYDDNVEVMWRKSRSLYQLAMAPDLETKLKTDLANKAYDTISAALKLNDNNYAVHKWMSVILDLKSSCDGLKERIKNLEIVKNHMLRAVEINPKDATTLYMLGEWCYRITDMPWYQRKIAQTLFANPPTSTFEEAIIYFSKAEIVEPRFYSMNLLMLGKTYLKLGKEDIGKYYLNLALSYPARSNDDHQANKEAQEVLKTLC